MQTKWLAVLLVVVAILSLLRIVSQWRRFARKQTADWDEQFIIQLRKAGVNSFSDQIVDFFFTLPDAKACEELRFLLAKEGFAMVGQSEVQGGGYSLNLQKTMRLLIPEMQALTARLRALATERGGTYDSWAVARPS
ncbi:MAG: ribonuclease E inhibitor RraB [Steroidobacteraceae bacterium]